MSIRFGRSGGNYSSSEVMQTENDDWRKIEDVTERRRIQNRLAQRNYRRKLRAKLEELEKKAGSDSGASVLSGSTGRTARATSQAASSSSSSARSNNRRSNSTPDSPPATADEMVTTPSSAPTPAYGQHVTLSQPVPDSSGPFNLDVSLDTFLQGVDDMLGPIFPAVSMGESPRITNVPSNNNTQFTPASTYESEFTPHSSTSSAYTPAPFGMPIGTIYRPPGYLIPPSFSPPPEDRPSSRSTLDTPDSNFLGTGSDSSQSSHDAMTPSASSSSSRSDSDNASEIGGDNLSGRSLISREDYLAAMSGIILPPGFQDVINPDPTPKQKTFLQQLVAARPPSIPSDHKLITMQFSNIFNASILNGIILSFDTVLMIDEDAISPFNDQIALSPNIPKDLEPTAMQMSIPHHPYIDIVPFPGFRDRMLRFLDIIDEDDVCCMMYSDWGVWGNRPWDKTSWEVGEKFAEKYWFLMDDDMKKTSNFWRAQRGLKPLKSQQSRKVERGKVVGEV